MDMTAEGPNCVGIIGHCKRWTMVVDGNELIKSLIGTV
jgi:hypothetical protein